MHIRNEAGRGNRVALAIAQKRRAIGFHMVFAAPPIIDILGREGFDFVYLDAEHGSFTLHDIDDACRAAERAGITVIVRVPGNDPVLISRYLDHGVQGIVVPHVSTAEAARAAVDACFYLPKGRRPYSSARINDYRTDIADFEALFAFENANVTLTVQIEDVAALANLNAILDVEGIDYITIGKHDLALSMGLQRTTKDVPGPLDAALKTIGQAIAGRNLLVKDDVMVIGRVRDFLVSGASDLLKDIPQ